MMDGVNTVWKALQPGIQIIPHRRVHSITGVSAAPQNEQI